MTFMNTTDDENKPSHLRLMIGGKQPPKKGGNWLEKLKQYTVFDANNPKLSIVDCFRCTVWEKYANTTVLQMRINLTEEPQVRLVSTEGFSNEYFLMGIVDEPGEGTDYDRRMEGSQILAQSDAYDNEGVVRESSGSSELSER